MRKALYVSLVGGLILQFFLAIKLPEAVVSNFNGSGAANGWMNRESYMLITTLTLVFNSLLFLFFDRIFEKVPAGMISFPYKHYWLSPERRAGAIRRMVFWTDTLGIVVNIFLLSTFILVFLANRTDPVQLNNGVFITLLSVFAALVICWVAAIYVAFRPPGPR